MSGNNEKFLLSAHICLDVFLAFFKDVWPTSGSGATREVREGAARHVLQFSSNSDHKKPYQR